MKHLIKFIKPFMIKILNKFSIEGTYLNIINGIHNKPRANIINIERLKAFPLISGTNMKSHT